MSRPLHVDARVDRGGFVLDLDLTVAPGELVAVVGPNGAGKSTLLRAIAGLDPVSAGEIRVGTTALDSPARGILVPPEHRPVALAFQDHRLFPHLSALDNVAFPLRARGAGRTGSRAAALPHLEQVGLAGAADRRPADLSGGESQRVALARALAMGPDVLLLDEPMSALDARTRLTLRAHLREHLSGFDGPVLLVTHDPVDALVLADRIVVLEAGRISQVGTPAEVTRHPHTDYVARLVGLNLYAGRRIDAHDVDVDGGGRLVVGDALPDTERVHVVVRPSSLVVHTEHPGESSPRNVWRGTLRELDLVGERVRAVVDGPPDAIVDLTPGAVAALDLRPGRPVWLSVKATDLEAFPD